MSRPVSKCLCVAIVQVEGRRQTRNALNCNLHVLHGLIAVPCMAIGHMRNVGGRRIPSVGAIAQLVERLNGIQEVRGSTPLGSTIKSRG
jgi:hypothetical protein